MKNYSPQASCARALASAFLVLSCVCAKAQNPPAVSDNTLRQLQAIEADKSGRNAAQSKISSDLLGAIKARKGEPVVGGAPELRAAAHTLHSLQDGQISVDIKGNLTPELRSFITSQGGQVTANLPAYQAITAKIPPEKVEELAARPEVKSIEETPRAIRNQSISGLQNREGEIAHAAATARQQFNVTGSGVKVCVISDSVDFLQQAQLNGSLGAVEVLPGAAGSGTGEGTAMLEIIHRIAPGALLGFATGDGGPNVMAANIDRLADAGCKIIVDDLSYANESPFQDGIIAQAVNAVSGRGVIYFSSAANSGNMMNGESGTWEGDFVADSTAIPIGGQMGHLHLFAPGMNSNAVTSAGMFGRVDLFWNDPLGDSTSANPNRKRNEYDLFILDADGNVVSTGNTVMQGTQDPHQTATAQIGQKVLIFQPPGTEGRFLHLDTNRGSLQVGTAGSTHGHNASGADNAFTVASVSAEHRTQPFSGGTNVHVDKWSSDGPRRMFYRPDGTELTTGDITQAGGVLLRKPDISAANCVTTDVPDFAPFCGTSAAAPHAAAIAALVMSSNPALTPAQIRTILTSTSLDIEIPGWDSASGFGIVMPGPALVAATAQTNNTPAASSVPPR
jgi:subtilisin family serine protease